QQMCSFLIQGQFYQFMQERGLSGSRYPFVLARVQQDLRHRIGRGKANPYRTIPAEPFCDPLGECCGPLGDQQLHASILPSFITTVRSEIRANSSLWVTITKVCPRRSRRSMNRACRAAAFSESRLP